MWGVPEARYSGSQARDLVKRSIPVAGKSVVGALHEGANWTAEGVNAPRIAALSSRKSAHKLYYVKLALSNGNECNLWKSII